MTDKERILMIIIMRIIPGLSFVVGKPREEYVESCLLNPEKLQKGDLVFANTTLTPNDFSVGFVENVEPNCVIIREIGSNQLCNYYNESFTKINKERLGYEILEGTQYKIYKKALKAFSKYVDYWTRFGGISFDGNICTVNGRKAFSQEIIFEASFPYNSKTSVKAIGEILKAAELESSEDKP